MKQITKTFGIISALFSCLLIEARKDTVITGCVVTPYQIVTVSPIRDVNDNCVIQVLGGAVGSDPNTWVTTIISDDVSSTNNFSPHIVSNALGDIIITWMYIDESAICQVAASILLHGTNRWHTTTLSNGNGTACYNDHTAFINEAGYALVIWTAYQSSTNTNDVFGVTAQLSISTSWSTPFIISD